MAILFVRSNICSRWTAKRIVNRTRRLTATDDQYSASSYGSVGVSTPTPEVFVSYDDLTEEEVTAWVVNALGVNEPVQFMKDGLAAQIETKKLLRLARW
jgi:hypothetical protein